MPILEQVIQYAAVDKPRNEVDVSVVTEGIRLAEVLVSLAEDQTSKSCPHRIWRLL